MSTFSTRRGFIRGALLGGASAAALAGYVPRAMAANAQTVTFTHNVASGDPLSDRVILWTRATADQAGDFYLFYFVSPNADMRSPVAGGSVLVRADNDYCCKVDATGLQPGRTYYFQFFYRDSRSPIGKTKTAPIGQVANARFAFFSCANHPKGYFNVYREAALRTDLDAVIFLGDYIYEYGPTGYVTAGLAAQRNAAGQAVSQPRIGALRPAGEILALADYRTRYALYRSDTHLQELHRLNPWVVVWDDHEITNDTWRNGAENHQPTEGDFQARLQAAARVYHEWMPIRTAASGNLLQIYRSFDYGDLVRIVMLDTRIEGRDEYAVSQAQFLSFYLTAQPNGTFPADVVPGTTTPRRMMSAAQETFIGERLTASTQTWQLIGNQTLLHFQSAPNFAATQLLPPPLRDQILAGISGLLGGPAALAQYNQLAAAGLPLYDFVADSWAAYPTNRLRFLGQLLTQTRNPIVITGDSHNAWAANLRLPTPAGITNVGVEFATPSVSSPGFEEAIIDIPPSVMSGVLVESNTNPTQTRVDQLLYCDVSRRGFVVLDFTPQRVEASFIFVSTVFDTAYTAAAGPKIQVLPGQRRIGAIT